jgi:hypothetical protein
MLFVEKLKKLKFVLNWINEAQKIFRKLPKINYSKTISKKKKSPPFSNERPVFILL